MTVGGDGARHRLAIVVLNYRTPDLVVDCLRSLEGEVAEDPGAVVVVVDNDSGDGSADRIDAAIASGSWGDWVSLVRSDRNGGFAAGNNLGIARVEADRYLLLNSDTIVRPGAIARLEQALEADDAIGVVGPRLEDRSGRRQASCFRFRRPATELVEAASMRVVDRLLPGGVVVADPPEPGRDPDWISYACVLLRRRVLDDVGPLDDGYFMYYEDLDHCRRIRAAGWRIVHEPEARVVHLEGESSGVSEATRTRRRRPRYFYASRSRYYARFHGPAGPLLANLCWLAGRTIAAVRELGGRPRLACRREWRDIWIGTVGRRRPS